MATGKFKLIEETNEETGEVTAILDGEICTLQEKLMVRLEPIAGAGDEVNSDRPSHLVKVKAVYGEYIECGSGWAKRKERGPLFWNGTINDKNIKFTVYPEDDNPGHFKALVSYARAA